MPNITLAVDDETARRMKAHPEIRWTEVARQAIQRKLQELALFEEAFTDSQLTEEDVRELARAVDERLAGRYRRDVAGSE